MSGSRVLTCGYNPETGGVIVAEVANVGLDDMSVRVTGRVFVDTFAQNGQTADDVLASAGFKRVDDWQPNTVGLLSHVERTSDE